MVYLSSMSNKQVANSKSVLAACPPPQQQQRKKETFHDTRPKIWLDGEFSAGIRELAHVFIIIMFFSPKDSLYLCIPSLYYDDKTIIKSVLEAKESRRLVR